MATSWREQGLSDESFQLLAEGLPPTTLWSLLLPVMARRAGARDPAALLRQFEQDDFTAPCPVDQRTLVALDGRLLQAAAAFEALELSPVAPLGACSAMGFASQHKVLSALRGTEVCADPTNVLALECARRLRRDPAATVRLASSQRVVRAQRLPPLPERQGLARHFRQHFRIFVLATAGREQKDHALVVASLIEQINTHLDALDLLEQDGYAFPGRFLRLLATEERAQLLPRVAAAFAGRVPVTLGPLEHRYYSGGLRFLLGARLGDDEVPFTDGGAFDWAARLTANRRHCLVASGCGAQLLAAAFRGPGAA